MRQFIVCVSLAFSLAAFEGVPARAQWGYPVGYGAYGWGGWGGGVGTFQGDVARGMGVYAAGAGYYNQQTAVANSINADTVMRWNQYVYESQQEVNRQHHARLAQERFNNSAARDQIRKRLRDNPEARDIESGDALNVALDEINDPRVYSKALKQAKVQIGGDAIRNIPFQYAAAAISVSVHQLTQGGPPAILLTPEFESERTTLRALGHELREQINAGKDPNPATIDKMLTLINAAEAKADMILPKNSRDRVEADRYLKSLHGLIAMLKTPAIDLLLAGVENRQNATLGELLNFMAACNLRFGPATNPTQRQVYRSLYPKLVDLRNEVAPALASSAAPAKSRGTEAGEFFSGMSYEDLKKKAPAPPSPGTTPK